MQELRISRYQRTLDRHYEIRDVSGDLIGYAKYETLRLKDRIEVFLDRACREPWFQLETHRTADGFAVVAGSPIGWLVCDGWYQVLGRRIQIRNRYGELARLQSASWFPDWLRWVAPIQFLFKRKFLVRSGEEILGRIQQVNWPRGGYKLEVESLDVRLALGAILLADSWN